jgi:hypothetical protein
VIRLVTRDLVACLLAKQVLPLTPQQIADSLACYGCGDLRQIHLALRQLEDAGTAVREHGRPWATPDQWTANRPQRHAATSTTR